MLQFDVRATPRLVQQVAQLERLTGSWERIYSGMPQVFEGIAEESISRGVRAALLLDTTTPVNLALRLRKDISPEDMVADGMNSGTSELWSPFAAMVEAHAQKFALDLDTISELYLRISGLPVSGLSNSTVFRSAPLHFHAPADLSDLSHSEEIVFPTVLPFLVETRISELLSWVNEELKSGVYHPLFVAGTFHLLFLQIHPFPSANHRLSLLLTWHLLRLTGYSFVEFAHFVPALERRSRQYFAVLRQAEKSARGNWLTLGLWLEFFLESVLEEARTLLASSDSADRGLRLTISQRRIMDIVRANGCVTREKVAKESGMNLSTIKYNLTVLSARGHLKREGGGRGTSYRAV